MHKEQFKAGPRSDEALRSARRADALALRKQHREKAFAVKRTCVDDDDDDDEGDKEEDSPSQDQMTELVTSLQHNNDASVRLKQLARWLSYGSLIVDLFLLVPDSIDILLKHLSRPAGQLEAIDCIANIAASMSTHTKAILPASPYLIALLASSEPVTVKCLWALGNMAGDGPECRDILRSQGVVFALVQLLQSSNERVIEAAAFVSSNIVRGPGIDMTDILELQLPLVLLSAFKMHAFSSTSTAAEVLYAFTYLTCHRLGDTTDAQSMVIDALYKNDFVPLALQLLQAYTQNGDPIDNPAIIPLIRTFGNLLCGGEGVCEMVLAGDVFLRSSLVLVRSSLRHVQLECTWALSVAAGGGDPACHAIISIGLVPHLVAMLAGPMDFKREAAYVLLNLCTHGEEVVRHLTQARAPNAFVELLKGPEPEIIDMALQFYEMLLRLPEGPSMLKSLDATETIDNLTFHANESVRRHATDLIEAYFQAEEEAEDD